MNNTIKANDWIETLVDKKYFKNKKSNFIPKGKKLRVVKVIGDSVIINNCYQSIYGDKVRYKLNQVKPIKHLRRFLMGDFVMVIEPIPLYTSCTKNIIAYLPVGVCAPVCEPYNDNEVMLEVDELIATNYNFLVDCDNKYIDFFDWKQYKKQFKIGSKVRIICEDHEEELPEWCPWNEPGTIIKFVKDKKALIEFVVDGKKYTITKPLTSIVIDNKVFELSEWYVRLEETMKKYKS